MGTVNNNLQAIRILKPAFNKIAELDGNSDTVTWQELVQVAQDTTDQFTPAEKAAAAYMTFYQDEQNNNYQEFNNLDQAGRADRVLDSQFDENDMSAYMNRLVSAAWNQFQFNPDSADINQINLQTSNEENFKGNFNYYDNNRYAALQYFQLYFDEAAAAGQGGDPNADGGNVITIEDLDVIEKNVGGKYSSDLMMAAAFFKYNPDAFGQVETTGRGSKLDGVMEKVDVFGSRAAFGPSFSALNQVNNFIVQHDNYDPDNYQPTLG